jgi:hypothetical protein
VDAPAVSPSTRRVAVLQAYAPSRQPNLTLSPAATLAVGTTCPTQVSECGAGTSQLPAKAVNLPPRQDCVPPPQVPSTPASVLIGRSSNRVPGC